MSRGIPTRAAASIRLGIVTALADCATGTPRWVFPWPDSDRLATTAWERTVRRTVVRLLNRINAKAEMLRASYPDSPSGTAEEGKP